MIKDSLYMPEAPGKLPEIQLRALEAFALTTAFDEASFVLNDGSLLSLGEERTRKGHEAIGVIFGLMSSEDAVTAFLNTGAVRFARYTLFGKVVAVVEFTCIPNEVQTGMIVDGSFMTDVLEIELSRHDRGYLRDGSTKFFERLESPRVQDVKGFLTKARRKVK